MTKAWILAGLLLIPFYTFAEEYPLASIPGLLDHAAAKSKEAKAAGLIDFNGQVSGAAYLPVWIFHGTERAYFETGLGGTIRAREQFRPLIGFDANLPAISARFWSFPWAKAHVTRTKFPPIWLGPIIRIPLPSDRFQWRDWKAWSGFILSIRLGK